MYYFFSVLGGSLFPLLKMCKSIPAIRRQLH